jgi:hypothetical protein
MKSDGLRHLEIEWHHKETGRQRAGEDRKSLCSPQICCIPTKNKKVKKDPTKCVSGGKKECKKN